MRGSVYKAHHDAYIEIATEQRKIDIEKTWNWIDYMLGTQSATPDFVEESYNRFKLAMEEE